MKQSFKLAAAMTAFVSAGPALAADCGTSDGISIVELNWPSGAFLAQVHKIILSEGYGCDVSLVPGDTASSTASMSARGEPNINPELWVDNVRDFWDKVTESGTVYEAGKPFAQGGREGFYIPTYVAEANPELKSFEDLAEYAELFSDPSDPSKGVIYNCQPGWSCEVLVGNMYRAFGLEEEFNLFSPGSSAALEATIERSYRREQPIVTYYWEPTPLLGKFPMVSLEMPDYVEGNCNNDENCENPAKSGFPPGNVITAVTSDVKEEAPEAAAYLDAASIDNSIINEVLAWGEENNATAEETAIHFLQENPDVWKAWVPDETAEKIQSGL